MFLVPNGDRRTGQDSNLRPATGRRPILDVATFERATPALVLPELNGPQPPASDAGALPVAPPPFDPSSVGTVGIEPTTLQESGFTTRCGPSHSAAYPCRRLGSAGDQHDRKESNHRHAGLEAAALPLSYCRKCCRTALAGALSEASAARRDRGRNRTCVGGVAARRLTSRPRDHEQGMTESNRRSPG